MYKVSLEFVPYIYIVNVTQLLENYVSLLSTKRQQLRHRYRTCVNCSSSLNSSNFIKCLIIKKYILIFNVFRNVNSGKNLFLKIVFQVMLFNVNSSLHYSLSIILHMDVYTLRMTQIHTPRSYTPFFLIPQHNYEF